MPSRNPFLRIRRAHTLGIYQPTVAMGDAVFPVLTSRPAVRGPFTGENDAAETTGAFDSELLAPSRLQASFLWKRTDAARFTAMDSALRMALNEGLAEKADQEIVNGSEGLLNGTNLDESQHGRGDELCELPKLFLLRPSRWPLCSRSENAPGLDGRRDLRSRGFGLSLW